MRGWQFISKWWQCRLGRLTTPIKILGRLEMGWNGMGREERDFASFAVYSLCNGPHRRRRRRRHPF